MEGEPDYWESEMSSSTFRDFLSLGAGVTPAEGSVKPTAGFTLDEVYVYPLRRQLLRRHLAVAVELRALIEYEAGRVDRALDARRRHQLDPLTRSHFAAERTGDRHLGRGNPRAHHGAGRDDDFFAADLAFRFAFDFHRAAEVELARDLGAFSDSRFELFISRHMLIAFPDLGFHYCGNARAYAMLAR